MLLIATLLTVWFATVKAERGWEHFVVDLLFISALLVVLFFAEALEIAYTFLSEKNPDEFGDSEGKIIEDIRKRANLVYEARL